MTDNFWKDKYPVGVESEINPDEYRNVQAVLKASCERFADKPAFSNLGRTLTYGELYELSGEFAAYLQHHTDLQPGDRIAVQLPNLLQYPVVVFGALRAGLIVVNTNPLYTKREMEHQFNDSGAKALVCLANMAHLAEEVVPKTGVKHVIVTEVGDMLPPLKRFLINAAVKYLKKMVPAYNIPGMVRFNDAMAKGRGQKLHEAAPKGEDIAVLQYTGGTTGVAKGAMLTHRNLVANMLQSKELMASNMTDGEEVIICPLPLYHIYAFTFHCMAMMVSGNHNVLITNPRDIPAFVKELSKFKFTGFVGLNTLFVALCNDEGFRALDFSKFKVTLSGGMALQLATAERWKQVTGCDICEGFGMTETSPVSTQTGANDTIEKRVSTVGRTQPHLESKIVDPGNGGILPRGEIGELCTRGYSVMLKYWNNDKATAEAIDETGWMHTGDLATMDDEGYIQIVGRIKDMVIRGGENVYPKEIEEFLYAHPAISEVQVTGVPDKKYGEELIAWVKLNSTAGEITGEDLREYCKGKITHFKIPRYFKFVDEFPMTVTGKIQKFKMREISIKELGLEDQK